MDERKKFTLTRGNLILLIILAVFLIVFIISMIPKGSSNNKYALENFEKLESRMEEEVEQYISQNKISIKSGEEKTITLKELINSQAIIESDITDVCEGYVIVKKEAVITKRSYISCGKYYISDGYKQPKTTKKTTTKEPKDTEKPVIILNGEAIITINQDATYVEPGAKALDNNDGDLTADITINGDINISKPGTYVLYYTVEDKAGNKETVTRQVIVKSIVTTTRKYSSSTTTRAVTKAQNAGPIIVLKGSKQVLINQYGKYVEPGYTASDYYGNSLTSKVNISGNLNTAVPGTYTKTYTVKDSYNNQTSVVRVIVVVASTTIKLKGIAVERNTITLAKAQKYQIVIYYTPSNASNKTLSWSSNNTSVATVNSYGLVTANGKGTALITTTSIDGGYKAYTSVTVN